MSLNILASLFGTVVSSFIPADFAVKSLCAQAISQAITEAHAHIPRSKLWRLLLPTYPEVWIGTDNPIYHRLEHYVIHKFASEIHSAGIIMTPAVR